MPFEEGDRALPLTRRAGEREREKSAVINELRTDQTFLVRHHLHVNGENDERLNH